MLTVDLCIGNLWEMILLYWKYFSSWYCKILQFCTKLAFENNFWQALQADVAAHKDMIDKLAEKAGQVKDGVPHACVSEIQTRYARLQQACKVACLK